MLKIKFRLLFSGFSATSFIVFGYLPFIHYLQPHTTKCGPIQSSFNWKVLELPVIKKEGNRPTPMRCIPWTPAPQWGSSRGWRDR